MTSTENIQALPIWVWLSFTIIVIGIIAIIYNYEKWRSTLSLTVIALCAVLFSTTFDQFHNYLNTHFIGSYDQLGIPFQQSPPGWSLILAAWPLWLLPVVAAIALTFSVWKAWLKILPTDDDATETTSSTSNVAKQLEISTFKQELTIALNTIDKQAVDNQALVFKIASLEKSQQETIKNLNDRILAFTLEIEARDNVNQQLANTQFKQAEEIVRLTRELTKIQKSKS